ncbi:MAG TPA: DNA-formamidopyrimidine glycosylase family protein [Terriglobales bacterium]|nr:DNA-formamidopyrimidine glycosylase family protein [Terriglobales bacterium]
MPELPDIVVYVEALEKRILGRKLEEARVMSPFLLRTAQPPLESTAGKKVVQLRRMGKRICIGMEEELWLVLHLMIAGRLHWEGEADGERKTRGGKSARSNRIAEFRFEKGTLNWTEAGTQKRASLHVVKGEAGLRALDPGGLEVLESDAGRFAEVLLSENHTLKRALTDPTLFSGIGNAYSDEILFAARLSPLAMTEKLSVAEIQRLYQATRTTLQEWTERLRAEAGEDFPEGVTAFRKEMAVHGKYKQPCVRCGTKIQRIRYASNETNYCPQCQTGGRLLADRALSRLLRADWPRTLEEMENRKRKAH